MLLFATLVIVDVDQELFVDVASNISYFDSVLHKIAEEFDEEEDKEDSEEELEQISGVGVERAICPIEGDIDDEDDDDDDDEEEEDDEDKDNGWLFKNTPLLIFEFVSSVVLLLLLVLLILFLAFFVVNSQFESLLFKNFNFWFWGCTKRFE